MPTKLIVVFVVVPLYRNVLDRAVHPFNLAVGPRMIGLGEAMLNAVCFADHVEPHWPRIDCVPVPGLLCELDAIVRQYRVDFVGHGLKEVELWLNLVSVGFE
jgi:hypothetical protein